MDPSASAWWLGILAAGLLAGPAEPGSGRRTATVRVYGAPSAPDRGRPWALAVADAIVAAGGVDVRWLDCAAQPIDCDAPAAAGEFVVRLQPGPRVAHVWADVPLGAALIVPHTGTGVFATVYTDRVDRKAGQSGVDSQVLLGRALAHELGHLLLGTTAHTSTGLMRPVWTKSELQRNHPDDWRFTTRDIAEVAARRAP